MKSPKIQRWIDLLAALLTRRFPVPLEEIVREVPGYQHAEGKRESARRKFERDKDELRRFGVLIETVPMPEGGVEGYRLLSREFYLPYLSLMAEGRPPRPRKLDRYGYASLPALSFEPDELDAVGQAAVRVRELADPLLTEHAESAIRKLASDLPMDATRPNDTTIAPGHPQPAPDVFAVLGAALQDRKRVSFDYHSMGSDATGRRTVEPFGLFFLNQHWYLAGRAPGEQVVKNYRLSRISAPLANDKQPGTPDYEVPAGFRLAEHAASKHAWELGDGDAVEAVVEFRREGGAAAAAARLGETVPGHPRRRRFRVRRREAFARWLLSFAGDLAPLSPPELVTDYARLVEATLAAYAPPPR